MPHSSAMNRLLNDPETEKQMRKYNKRDAKQAAREEIKKNPQDKKAIKQRLKATLKDPAKLKKTTYKKLDKNGKEKD